MGGDCRRRGARVALAAALLFSVFAALTAAVLLANWNGSSWTTSPSPIPADSSVSIGSAASSPSHVWLFGTNYNAGNEPLILSHS